MHQLSCCSTKLVSAQCTNVLKHNSKYSCCCCRLSQADPIAAQMPLQRALHRASVSVPFKAPPPPPPGQPPSLRGQLQGQRPAALAAEPRPNAWNLPLTSSTAGSAWPASAHSMQTAANTPMKAHANTASEDDSADASGDASLGSDRQDSEPAAPPPAAQQPSPSSSGGALQGSSSDAAAAADGACPLESQHLAQIADLQVNAPILQV